MYDSFEEAISHYSPEDPDPVKSIMDKILLLTKDEFERFINTLESDYDLVINVR
jgi:hypothetical protein